jgi:hypothetical protein
VSATLVVPDQIAASREFLRGNASQVHPAAQEIVDAIIAEIGSTGWIETFIPDRSQLPRNAIRVGSAGGLGPIPEQPGYTRRRVQFQCYGATRLSARRIATLVMLAFMPAQRNQQGFLAANTRIVATYNVTGPMPGVDPDAENAYFETVTAELLMLETGFPDPEPEPEPEPEP